MSIPPRSFTPASREEELKRVKRKEKNTVTHEFSSSPARCGGINEDPEKNRWEKSAAGGQNKRRVQITRVPLSENE